VSEIVLVVEHIRSPSYTILLSGHVDRPLGGTPHLIEQNEDPHFQFLSSLVVSGFPLAWKPGLLYVRVESNGYRIHPVYLCSRLDPFDHMS